MKRIAWITLGLGILVVTMQPITTDATPSAIEPVELDALLFEAGDALSSSIFSKPGEELPFDIRAAMGCTGDPPFRVCVCGSGGSCEKIGGTWFCGCALL